jgi:hypothetical protein
MFHALGLYTYTYKIGRFDDERNFPSLALISISRLPQYFTLLPPLKTNLWWVQFSSKTSRRNAMNSQDNKIKKKTTTTTTDREKTMKLIHHVSVLTMLSIESCKSLLPNQK